ncbi:MAG: EVE domain-containing protein [Bacteroidetes bacterium]|nr:EVE domain-containing protein [Bacteroidota bacterium]
MANYWLLKSEPTAYSIDDLARDKQTDWGGVRNYQARNTIRDLMSKGDLAFFYHSSSDVIGIVGICEIASDAHADPTALDAADDHYDPKSTPDNPIWYSRTVKFKQKLKNPITLAALKTTKGLEKMVLLQRGSRLSVQPVSESEWGVVMKLLDK